MIIPLIKGLLLTIKRFLNPYTCVTVQYPDERPKIATRFRGLPELQIGKDGMDQCIACGLCAKVCPSNCIYVEGTTDKKTQKGKRLNRNNSWKHIYFISWQQSQ